MARRTGKSPSRLELRKAAEAAEKAEGGDSTEAKADAGEAPAAKKKVAKKPAKPRVSKKKKKTDPTRMRLVWGVFDNSNQQVATFGYTERSDADKKASDMSDKGRGPYFVQPVKEPIPLEATDE